MVVGLIQSLIGGVFALVLLLMFPWLLVPALVYWCWRRGLLGRALRRAGRWARGIDLRGRISGIDASVSTGMVSYEEAIRYQAPWEDSPYVVVEKEGERRMLIAAALKDRAGTRSDYGRVVVEVMALTGGLSWTMAFSFFLSREGEVGGLIVLERPAPAKDADQGIVEREVRAQLDAVGEAVASVAPSLSVRSLRGRELAPLALWGRTY